MGPLDSIINLLDLISKRFLKPGSKQNVRSTLIYVCLCVCIDGGIIMRVMGNKNRIQWESL